MFEQEAKQVAEAIKSQFDRVEPGQDFIWTAAPAVKVIDCVIGLNRQYDPYVLPRVTSFAEKYPEVQSCWQLQAFIQGFDSPNEFFLRVLTTDYPNRARVLVEVNEYMIAIQNQYKGNTEEELLHNWAIAMKPTDYKVVGVKDFAVAGFQYMRMLFGAETAKPDVHIMRYVSSVIGRKVSELDAVCILELAAKLNGLSLRWLDVAIWKKLAR